MRGQVPGKGSCRHSKKTEAIKERSPEKIILYYRPNISHYYISLYICRHHDIIIILKVRIITAVPSDFAFDLQASSTFSLFHRTNTGFYSQRFLRKFPVISLVII
jgi:hypothetical protein